MKKLKHSKFKNTGILFELLVRQIATDTLNNKDSKATDIIREHFGKNSELAKELRLYQSAIKESFDSEYKASEFLNIILKERNKLTVTTLSKQKYNLIKDIKSNFVLEDFFNYRVSNYKENASIYKLFEYLNSENPKEYVDCKSTLMEHLTGKSQYTHLSDKQRGILKEYINSVDNSKKLKSFVIRECNLLTKNIKLIKITDQVTKIKVNEVVRLISKVKSSKTITESQILSLLRYNELYSELKKAF